MYRGFITLHRKLTKWEWYTDTPTKSLFLHLLLMANHEDKQWRGQLIKRGQLITSLQHLADETGLSVKQVRRALNNLKLTNEITTVGTNKWTLVTVEKYSSYQDDRSEQGKQRAGERTIKGQTKGKQRATNNNDNNVNNDNNNNTYIVEHLNERTGASYKANTKKTTSLIRARMNEGFTVEDFIRVIDNKCDDWIGTEWEKFLRPETLFSNKFEGYLNQKKSNKRSRNEVLDMLQNGELS